jgi:hypothetical protein
MKAGGVINIIKKVLPADPKVVIKNKPAARRGDLGGLTPLLAIVASGGLAGLGLAIPAPFAAACQGFITGGVSGLCQTALGACGPLVQSALGSLPGGLSGIASGITASSLGELGINTDNVVGGCLGQAQQLFSNEVTGIMETAAAANSFCEGSYDICSALGQAQSLNLPAGDLGINFKSITDTITGGISQITNDAKTFFANFEKLGTMLDPTDLAKAATPAGFAENLINQGFGEPVLAALNEVGITNVTELVAGNDALITQALDSIPKEQIAAIVEQTGFQGTVNKLSDVLKDFKTEIDKAAVAIGTSPLVATFPELGRTLQQISQPVVPLLNAANTDRNAWDDYFVDPAEVKSKVGSGSGIFGNPTLADVIGVAAGIGFTDRILNMTASQQRVLATPQGQALQTALNNAIANPGNDAANAAAITAAAAAFNNPTSETLAKEVFILNENFNGVANKIITEKRNLIAARIDLTENTGSVDSLLAFVQSLHTMHEDPKSLGYADFIIALTTNDVYGEAIRAAILEGKNLKLLELLGVTPNTRLDTDAYGQQVLAQRSIDNCCPPAG